MLWLIRGMPPKAQWCQDLQFAVSRRCRLRNAGARVVRRVPPGSTAPSGLPTGWIGRVGTRSAARRTRAILGRPVFSRWGFGHGRSWGCGNALSKDGVGGSCDRRRRQAERLLDEPCSASTGRSWFLTWALYVRAIVAVRREMPMKRLRWCVSLTCIRDLQDKYVRIPLVLFRCRGNQRRRRVGGRILRSGTPQ